MAKLAKESAYSVFLVDDSDADRALLRQSLRDNPRLKIIGEACDGVEAINYLSKITGNTDHPDLLLLDLRMPRKTGYEVLEWLQKQSMRKMLVVVLAGSDLPEDYKKSLDLGAHAYYVKIPQREARLEMIRSIETLLQVAREGEIISAK